jgi:NAD-dependent dihydropyrimidine dehydrogenase PreA subunit/flavodoxin
MVLKMALVYFSGTGVTAAIAQVIGDELGTLGCEVNRFVITSYASRQVPFQVGEFDTFIFGFPVYADFAPSVINDWIPTLDGQGKRCGMFFTYGARTTGYAHFHTKMLLEAANFQVYFSAEFLGRHTFNVGGWTILPNRPDVGDFQVAKELAKLAVNRFTDPKAAPLQLQRPFGYHHAREALDNTEPRMERAWTNPFRSSSKCSMCRDCESECPTQSFDADTGFSDPTTCIECMHCLYICPDQVIQVDDRMEGTYEKFKAYCHLTEAMMEAKQSKIITEFWQAAA